MGKKPMDPARFQARDVQRRLTRAEAAIERLEGQRSVLKTEIKDLRARLGEVEEDQTRLDHWSEGVSMALGGQYGYSSEE